MIVATRATGGRSGSGSTIAIRRPPRVSDDAQEGVDRAGGLEQRVELAASASWSASRRSPSQVCRSRAKWSESANGRPP